MREVQLQVAKELTLAAIDKLTFPPRTVGTDHASNKQVAEEIAKAFTTIHSAVVEAGKK